MRILIISDTHGMHRNFSKVLGRVGEIDMLLHMGDVEGGEYFIEQNAGCEVHIVEGNNDWFSELPAEEELQIGEYKVLMTHGHDYYVSRDTKKLKEEARARGVQIVMYGHTHKPDIEIEDGLIVLNPGSLSYPRQSGRRGSYILMELDESGEVSFEIDYV